MMFIFQSKTALNNYHGHYIAKVEDVAQIGISESVQ